MAKPVIQTVFSSTGVGVGKHIQTVFISTGVGGKET